MSEQAEPLPQPNNIVAEVTVPASSLTPTLSQGERERMLRILEAALLTAQEPLSLAELKKLSDMKIVTSAKILMRSSSNFIRK